MALSFRRWGARHLLLAWLVYWAALIVVGLGRALLAIRRATSLPDGHGTVSANFGDGNLMLTVIENGVTTYSGSVGVLAAALWIAGPPLVLWLAWLVTRPRRDAEAATTAARVS
ncbi:MAG TPA: hypothetical protein VKA84_10975 [Gemmatimonadaceae bacterium]|nr:hypothetical protein [Gemmatimonadaceae bacterium]